MGTNEIGVDEIKSDLFFSIALGFDTNKGVRSFCVLNLYILCICNFKKANFKQGLEINYGCFLGNHDYVKL